MSNIDFTPQLQNLMQRVGFSSFKAFGSAAGVSQKQILRLRRGEIERMRLDILLKLSQALQISLTELISIFSQLQVVKEKQPGNQELLQKIANLTTEYERSQQQLEQQQQQSQQQFQQESLQLLESLLVQFPTAAQKARENPQLAAVKIVPLVEKPLEKLLQMWGIEVIAPVGAEIAYNPQLHQLISGTVQPGEMVKVRYTGYRQGDKLLFRAKVSPR